MTAFRPSRVGFVGVGKLGRPIAERLIEAGHDLTVFDTDNLARSAFDGKKARVVTSLAEIGTRCEIVCLCLPGPTEVEQAVLARDGLQPIVRAGTLVIDHTTNSPATVRRIGEQLRSRGAMLIDAPVSGGIEGASAGNLTTLVGGDPEHLQRANPLLQAFSSAVIHIGPLGSGTVAKLMNNLATFALDQVVGECLTIGAKFGVQPATLLDALQQSAIGKGGNLHERLPDTLMRGDFNPRFTLSGAHKDVTLAVGMAKDAEVPVRIAKMVLDEMETALLKGFGDRDASIVLTLQEERSEVQISKPTTGLSIRNKSK